MRASVATCRSALLLLAAAFAVHQLRHYLTVGDHGHGGVGGLTSHAMEVQGAGLVVALLLAAIIGKVAVASRGDSATRVRVLRVWPLTVLAVLTVYGAQELVAGAACSSLPIALSEMTAASGWVAAPLALGFGALIALAVGVARRLEDAALGPAVRLSLRALAPTPAAVLLGGGLVPAAAPARHCAGRGPPLS